MTYNNTSHKTGDIIVFTTGEYSDYSIRDVYRALKDFEERAVYDEFIAVHPKPTRPERNMAPDHVSDYLQWFIEQGYVEEVKESAEIYLGDYSIINAPRIP